MADVLKILVMLQRITRRPRHINMIQMNQVFADRSDKDEIYPLTVKEIVEAQKVDNKLKHFFVHNATLDKQLELQIIEDETCKCN